MDFVLALGDLSYSGPQSEPRWCAHVLTFFPADFPFQILVGNHEDDYGGDGHITQFAKCLPDRMGAVGAYGVQYYFDYADLARFMNLLTSKWVEVSEPAQLARCLQPICHRVTTID